jgi:glyoxylase-like metal-dependent hydrolase (beta-lactamase superfamily II)
MHRIALIVLITVLTLTGAQAQAQDYDAVEITPTEVAEGIWMLEGAGGNLGVMIGEDGTFLIDDQYAPLSAKILAAIDELGGEQPRFVLNTHYHGDHTGGNEAMGEVGALIVAHDNVRSRMQIENPSEVFGLTFPPSPEAALPVLTFSETTTFHINGEEVHVFHVRDAHTDGDALVWFKRANVLHTGDIVFNGIYPYIDEGSGTIAGVIAACGDILAIVDGDTAIIPGHGPLADRDDVISYRNFLQGVHDVLIPMVRDGMSIVEILEAEPLQPWDETWGQGFLDTEAFTRVAVTAIRNELE